MSPMHDIGRAIDLYLGELARRGRSKATRQKYREVLHPFADHLEKRDRALADVTATDCRQFLDQWIDSAPSTLALYVSILRGFFDFYVREGELASSPMVNIQRPKRPRPEDIDVVSVAALDVEKLFAACQEWDDVLCIATLGYLGLRRSAAARARRKDVDLERGEIRAKEKGGKIVVKPVPDDLQAIYEAAEQANVWPSGDDYLIPNRRAPKTRERSAKVIYAIVKRVADNAGVDAHPHALRAAFATQFIDQHPGHLLALKDLMSHSRVETTLVYLRRRNRQRGMEVVRDLRWGASSVLDALRPRTLLPPAGFEPAFGEDRVPEPIRLKLAELRARNRTGARVDRG